MSKAFAGSPEDATLESSTRPKRLVQTALAWADEGDGSTARLGAWTVAVERDPARPGRFCWRAFASGDAGSRALGGRGLATRESAQRDAEAVLLAR